MLIWTVVYVIVIKTVTNTGIQWIMALCESTDTPHTIFFAALFAWVECLWNGDYECSELHKSCIMFNTLPHP